MLKAQLATCCRAVGELPHHRRGPHQPRQPRIELGDLARGFELQAEGRRAAERFGIPGWLRHLQAERLLAELASSA